MTKIIPDRLQWIFSLRFFKIAGRKPCANGYFRSILFKEQKLREYLITSPVFAVISDQPQICGWKNIIFTPV